MQISMLEIHERKTIRAWFIFLSLLSFFTVGIISYLFYLSLIGPFQGFMLIAISHLCMLIVPYYRYSNHLFKKLSDDQRFTLDYSKGAKTSAIHEQSSYQNFFDSPERNDDLRFRQLTDTITDSFCSLDSNLCFTYWNKASEKISGFNRKEVLGKHILDVFPEAEDNQFYRCVQQVKESGEACSFVLNHRINKKRYTLNIRIYPDNDEISVYTVDNSKIEEARSQLKQEKERLEMIFWGAGLGAWDWHIPSNKVIYNQQWADMVGYSLDELNGDLYDWKDRIHPDDFPKVQHKLYEHVSGKTPVYKAEHRMRTRDGKWMWTLDIGKVVQKDQDGKAVRVVGIHIDIHPHKALEDKLREQKAHLELAIQSANMGSWDWNVLEDTSSFSENWHNMFGYNPDDFKLQKNSWFDLIHPDDLPNVQEALTLHFEGHSDYFQCEHRIRHQSGKWVWTIGSGLLIERDNDLTPQRMIGIHQDLTILKERDLVLKVQNERLELTIQGADLGTWDWHIPSGIVTFNERWARMLGFALEEVSPHVDSWSEMIHPDDLEKVMKALNLHMEGKTDHYRIRHRLKTKQGSWKWILDSGKVVERDEKGKALRMIGIHMDIDASQKMEEEIRKQNEQMELALWAAELGTWDIDLREPYNADSVQINERCAHMSDHSVAEFKSLIGSSDWLALIHPDDRKSLLSNLTRHLKGELPFYKVQHRIMTQDGQWKWMLNTGKVVQRDKNGRATRFSGIQQDISELKEAESHLYFFSHLLENGGVPTYGLDPQTGNMMYVNNASCVHFGMEREELIGKKIQDWDPYLSKERIAAIIQKIKKDKLVTFETFHQRKNGEIIPVEISACYIFYEKREFIAGFIMDISERKAAEDQIKGVNTELIRQNDQLRQFGYITSHNIRGPLATTMGLVNLIHDNYRQSESDDQLFNYLDASLEKLDQVITDMNKIVEFKAHIDTRKEQISLSEILENVSSELLPHINQSKINIKGDFSVLDTVYSVKAYVNSIFYNLISNAIKYRRHHQLSYLDIKSSIESKYSQNWVCLCFTDNGMGMDLSNNKDKIFGLYKRFHQHIEGKGLGLHLVKIQVEALNGKIDVESKVGQGSIFKVFIPYKKTNDFLD